MSTNLIKLRNWLESKCEANVTHIGMLTIDGISYEAAKYLDHNNETSIYVIGDRPKCIYRRHKTVFNFEDDTRDWYVAAYVEPERFAAWINANPKAEYAKYHPFGAHFILKAWQVPSGEAIDAFNYWRGEHKPYSRVKASVEYKAR